MTLPEAIAWKVFTKRREAHAALAMFPTIRIDGDVGLERKALELVAVMA